MNNIENDLLDIIKSESQRLVSSPQILEYEKANEFFKKLVAQGLTKERGYNLQTLENAHLNVVCFNTI